MVIERMAHWWKLLHLQYYDPGVGSDFLWKITSGVPFKKAFNAIGSLFTSPVCEAAYCFFRSLLVLWVNCYYGWTNKEKIKDYRWWSLKLKLKWGPKTCMQLPLITIGATKDNKMKIFGITVLSQTNLIAHFMANTMWTPKHYTSMKLLSISFQQHGWSTGSCSRSWNLVTGICSHSASRALVKLATDV